MNARSFAALIALLCAGCQKDQPEIIQSPGATPTTQPKLVAPDWLPKGPAIRVLFIGNSLTAANGLPAMVQALAAVGGKRLEYIADTPGGTSLADHWPEGRPYALLEQERWNFLVLQQGPSTRPESRLDLITSAKRFSDAARKRGIVPGLYAVWPYKTQRNGFDLGCINYRDAAKEAKALLFPAGEAWRAASDVSPPIELYLSDGLHPTPAGSYLAALVIAEQLAGVKPVGMPNVLKMPSGATFEIAKDVAQRLQSIAQQANAQHRIPK